jgi:SIR2-like protein
MSCNSDVSPALDAIVDSTSCELVVLCGSGVSTVRPSSVPSWYQLNAAVLDGLRALAIGHVLTSAPSRTAAASLRPDDVPLVAFSQVLSDAFASRAWLRVLTVLDDDTTNGVHQALAALIRKGRCHAIITTNFDTLIERACRDAGLDVLTVVPGILAGAPGSNPPSIYKIHGCVQWPETMVDLLLDKQRGLRPSIQSAIASSCRGQHLVVLGYSGDDFAVNPDYLGLIAEDALPHKVTWVARPGSALGAGARAYLNALAARGVTIAIEWHQLEDLAGIASPNEHPAAETRNQRLTSHVRAWISDVRTYPPTAALVVAELLRLRGQAAEAAAVRAEIRRNLHRFEDNEVQLIATATAWALLGKEERSHELALADLRQAEQTMDRFDRFVAAQRISFHGQAVVEQQLLRAAIRQNSAVACLGLKNLEAADRFLVAAERILAEIPGPEAIRRTAGLRYREALHSLIRGELGKAMIKLEESIEHAIRCGDALQETGSTLLLSMCLRASGEDALAAVLDQRATLLGATATDALTRQQFENLVRTGDTAVASGMYDKLIAAITPDQLLDNVASARADGDPRQLASALLVTAHRDVGQYHRERLGQMLLSIDLAGNRSPASLYQRTVRALCATDLSELPERSRFLVKVTELGLNLDKGEQELPADVIEDLMMLGRSFDYRPCLFVPYGYNEGLRTLARNAAQTGNAAARRRDFEHAEALYCLGYHGMWQNADHVLATTAALYRCDALIALDRYGDAAACLELIRDFATSHLPLDYLVRYAEVVARHAVSTDPAKRREQAAVLAEVANNITAHAPRHAKRALINGAINLQRLGELDLARQLLDRLDVTTLTHDEADTFRALIADLADARQD